MLVRSLGIGAGLALAVRGFMVPNEVAREVTQESILMMNCPGCPMATFKDNKVEWREGVKNALILRFGISEKRDALLVNGASVFPFPTLMEGGIPEPINITQVPTDTKGPELAASLSQSLESSPLRLTGFSVGFDAARSHRRARKEIVVLDFSVLALHGRKLNPTPDPLRIILIKDRKGRLRFAGMQGIPDCSQVSRKEGRRLGCGPRERKACRKFPSVCKSRAFLLGRLQKMKEFIKAKGKHCGGLIRFHGGAEPPQPGFHGGRHGHHGPRPPFAARFLRILTYALTTMFFPILIGLVAGLATYLLGWAIGTSIAILVAFFARRRRGGAAGDSAYVRVALVDEERFGDAKNASDFDDDDGEDGDDALYTSSDDSVVILTPKSEKEVYVAEELVEVEGEAPPVYVEVAGKEVEQPEQPEQPEQSEQPKQ